MTLNKQTLLRVTLCLGALYYFIGAVTHYWGLTIFPWFDGHLYAPYQDSVIALTAIVLSIILLTVAYDPIKNIDILKVVIVCAILASIFSIMIIWKVDFVAVGAPDKKLQTIVEGILGSIFVASLLWTYPRQAK